MSHEKKQMKWKSSWVKSKRIQITPRLLFFGATQLCIFGWSKIYVEKHLVRRILHVRDILWNFIIRKTPPRQKHRCVIFCETAQKKKLQLGSIISNGLSGVWRWQQQYDNGHKLKIMLFLNKVNMFESWAGIYFVCQKIPSLTFTWNLHCANLDKD